MTRPSGGMLNNPRLLDQMRSNSVLPKVSNPFKRNDGGETPVEREKYRLAVTAGRGSARIDRSAFSVSIA